MKLHLKKINIIVFFTILTIIISNLSQLPYFSDNGLSSNICMFSWSVLFVMSFLFKPYLKLNKTFLIFTFIFILFSFLLFLNFLATQNNYFSSSMFYSFCVTLFVFVVGSQLSGINVRLKNWIFFSYVISALFVALIVYIQYFYNNITLDSRVYAYDSKNSLSQILLTAIIFTIWCVPAKYFNKIVKIVISAFLFLLIFLMRSRATILGIIFILFLVFTSKVVKIRYKFLLAIASFGFVFAIALNANLYNLLVNNILLAGRNSGDLNDISSGRVYLIKNGLEQFSNNFVFGIGPKYLDCFPVAAFLQFGFFPGIIICLYALYPIFFSLKNYNIYKNQVDNKFIYLALLMLSLIYCFNGLFECLTPLGPGVKCYIIWFLIGFFSDKNCNEMRFNSYEKAKC